MDITKDTVQNVFSYHAPREDQLPRYETIRLNARIFAEEILTATPHSRERSLALTKIQEAVMWANAAIALNEAPAAVDLGALNEQPAV